MIGGTRVPVAAREPGLAGAERGILIGALALGTLLRIMPVGYGLPLVFHPDETFLITDLGKILGALSQGSPTIGTSAFYYPLTFVYGLYFAFGRATGRFASLADFERAMLLDDPTLHLLGRLVSVVFSLGTLIVVYALGRRIYGRRGGLIAVVLMSVSLIDISSSHWLKFDSGVAFMSAFAVLAMLGLKDDLRATRRYAFAGVMVGLAVAARVDLLILVPLLIIAHLVVVRPAGLIDAIRAICRRSLLVALSVAVLVYVFASLVFVNLALQYVVGAPRLFTTREMGASLVQIFAVTDVLASLRHNIPFYLSRVMIGTCGLVLTAAIAVGIGRTVASRRTEEIILLAFVSLVSAPTLIYSLYGAHYLLRLMPSFMVLAAGGLLWLANRLERVIGVHGWILLLALVAAQPAVYSVQYVRYLRANTDTRARAREWIYAHIPAGERLAIEKAHELPRYVPEIAESRAEAETKLQMIRTGGVGSGLALEARLADYPSHTYPIVNLSLESYWSHRPDLENRYDLEQLKDEGVRYVVMSGHSNPPWEQNEDGRPFGMVFAPDQVDRGALLTYKTFVQQLQRSSELVAEFRSRDPLVVGRTDAPIDPTIRIYRLPAEGE